MFRELIFIICKWSPPSPYHSRTRTVLELLKYLKTHYDLPLLIEIFTICVSSHSTSSYFDSTYLAAWHIKNVCLMMLHNDTAYSDSMADRLPATVTSNSIYSINVIMTDTRCLYSNTLALGLKHFVKKLTKRDCFKNFS